jgi:hypothetical protein
MARRSLLSSEKHTLGQYNACASNQFHKQTQPASYKSLAETCLQRGDGVAAKGLEAFAGGLVMVVSACNVNMGKVFQYNTKA